MAIPYPDWLPLAQKPNKARSIDSAFRTDQPAVGAPIFQRLTDDLKTTWSLTWIFTLAQDRAFEQWYRSPRYLDNGNQWFTMLCNLGGAGLQLQDLHFVAPPVQTSINGNTTTWTGNVITRKVYNPDDEFSDVIVDLDPRWAGWLDEVVTVILPGVE
ncbi:Uncharacterised protein [Serratia proteamaculans]|uniref:hypothetical protein n=1 Tax=Serratia proteamaculans TaxID=28151 RepID=UPI00217C730D|nr:hypothetical protein [Serratia proteamaculans]CAI0728834.1 Uncharacterised protein [Serratia proteamaculans]CAI1523843.1 Uncharacterised protein [Serratia proteamaculans]